MIWILIIYLAIGFAIEVDLRGWHKQGTCGALLRVSAKELKEPPEGE